ncbi:MAG: S1 RNA-binding domain-containing protein [Acidobacteria bacterium]|nr:S1 RNA-binding domain-containing protein [Acidobacteriota bacterium]
MTEPENQITDQPEAEKVSPTPGKRNGLGEIKELRNLRRRRLRRKWFRYAGLPLLIILLMLGAGNLTGRYILKTGQDHTLMEKLRNFKPRLITKVYDIHGRIIGTFSREKRELITYDEIPKSFVQALVATEDASFFHHIGVDPFGVMRAAVRNVLAGRVVQGASTLTMQLVRLITGQRKTSMKRKITEAILAIQIERMFTKQEILERYSNLVYLGHGLYGIQAAANTYFGKDAAELTLSESAMLAGLVQNPYRYSPIRNIELARKRRNHVLKRMLAEGYITKETYKKTIEEPIQTIQAAQGEKARPGAYFLEEVRKYLYKRYGMNQVLDAGLNVYTTLDLNLQKAAEEAVRTGLKHLDKREGFRLEDKRFVTADEINTFWSPTWNHNIQEGITVDGLIVRVTPDKATVRIGKTDISIGKYEIVWTKAKHISDILKIGDVVEFKINKWNPEKNQYNISLDQEPRVQGALLAINHHTGEVEAMVGGYSFVKSEFNRAWNSQAVRQTGSVFKPILYAAALDSGFTLADTFFDEPTIFLDPALFYVDEHHKIRQFELTPELRQKIKDKELDEPKPYEPDNYHHSYDGLITLRTALEKSKNIVSVKLFNRVGQRKVRHFARACGITTNIAPFLSSALGATSITLKEACRAYGTFANGGIRTEPYFIRRVTDHYGKTLEETKPLTVQAVAPSTAYLIVSGMKGVIQEGTGVRARSLNWNLCGKTGTTDDYTDAWFVGSDPDLTVGVWTGFDQKKTLGNNETGAKAALPIWIDFMKAYIKGRPKQDWPMPQDIIRVPIDKRTGLLANPPAGCRPADIILETFKKGTEPMEKCNAKIHALLKLPYYQQHGKVIFDEVTGLPLPRIEFLIPHPKPARRR